MGLHFYISCRDHPELKGYSDEERLRLMMQARARRGDLMWIMPIAAVGIMLVMLAGGALGAAWVVHALKGSRAPYFADPLVCDILTMTLMAGGPCAVFVWLAARRELIMRSVLRHLVKARCPYCLFSLAGLPIDLGSVVCPECGQRILLTEEGLTPEDLLTPGGRHRTWKPRKDEAVELPPIPLEPESAAARARPRRNGVNR